MRALFLSSLYFGHFRFDPRRRALYQRGRRVPLRAKAAQVLHVLLADADQIVSKEHLRERVWGHSMVADHSLFQAICEVRRALGSLEAIVTHPNQGYRWAVPVRARSRAAPAIAAVVLPVLALGGVMLLAQAPAPDRPPSFGVLSPSMQAFAQGAALLGAGDAMQAESKLLLALREDAGFVEARLLLGESLLAQGRVSQALAEARLVLEANEALEHPDVHAAVAAMALISRAEDTAGSADRALHWAFEAAQRAQRGGLACTASYIEDRIDGLLAQRAIAGQPLSNRPPRPPTPTFCAEFAPTPVEPEAHTVPDNCQASDGPRRMAAVTGLAKTTA